MPPSRLGISELDESSPASRSDRFRAAKDIEFAEDAAKMRFNGRFADIKIGANLFVALATSQ